MLLPDSRPKVQRSVTRHKDINWTPIYCANCGKDGGFVPEENCNFAFYLCDPCAEKWSPLVDTYMVPDEVFWNKVKEEQLTKYGRVLQPDELQKILKEDNSLSKLCSDRKDFNTVKMS